MSSKNSDTLGVRVGKVVGERLRALGLTQAQLAAKAGCSQPVISELIAGNTDDPRASVLFRIAKALELSLDDLVAEHGPTVLPTTPMSRSELQRLRVLEERQAAGLEHADRGFAAVERMFEQLVRALGAQGVLTEAQIKRLLRHLSDDR